MTEKNSLKDASTPKCLEFWKEKKVLYKVWLKESTCRHAAFREQVIQSLLFTQKESGGERKPIHTAWMASLSSDDCYWEKQNRKGWVLIHFRHCHRQSLTLLMNVTRSRWAVTWETYLSIHGRAHENGSVFVPFAWDFNMMPHSDGALNLIW